MVLVEKERDGERKLTFSSDWNVDTNSWAIASGDYQVYVGASSRDIRLTGSFQVRYVDKE